MATIVTEDRKEVTLKIMLNADEGKLLSSSTFGTLTITPEQHVIGSIKDADRLMIEIEILKSDENAQINNKTSK